MNKKELKKLTKENRRTAERLHKEALDKVIINTTTVIEVLKGLPFKERLRHAWEILQGKKS